jgi:hypothetical protein
MIQVQNKTLESDGVIFNRSITNETIIEFNGQTVLAADYFPVWLKNLADDVTLEGSLLNGFVQGPEAIRAIVLSIRNIYESQEFSFAGPFRENFFFENYTASVKGQAIGCLVMIIRNAAGQAQHIAANYRPLNASLLLSRLVRENLDGTPYSKHFVDKKFD